uniref:Myosin light chain kinase 3 n=1 Tax=Sphenodon punctatus TaxID=8508 RepID=A0A8D0HKJ0_SPHPU
MSENNLESDEGLGNTMNSLQAARVNNLNMIDKRLNLLNEKVDKLLNFQEDLTGKLQRFNQGVNEFGRGINKLTACQGPTDQIDMIKRGRQPGDGTHQTDTQSVCLEILKLMKVAHYDASKSSERLDKIEKMVDSVDETTAFLGEMFKRSKIVDFILKGIVPWRKGSLIEFLEEVGSVFNVCISFLAKEQASRHTVNFLSNACACIQSVLHYYYLLYDSPPPPAPFEHRIVSVRQTELTAFYSVCQHEVLGGGRFGQVHKCTEKTTGLSLAAKIIKVKGAKEREEVKNDISIMNQLNHVNLIQLYDAFECKNNLTLIMEYVDGGELFDRITDENYHLTELDAILFTKQICEGVHYLHQRYILHLDLKPENILCVNYTGNQIKIIDFGLARRYKPREKLKVNFGTPEFLAPEVVNYDFVSFPTDMWSVGVITYMLLSGLSPFLGETDTETMNYIVNCSWDFDAEAFEQLSEEAKDFVSKLLVKEKSGRTSAAQCLKHEWLNDLPSKAKKSKARLKSQLLLQSYLAHRKWKVLLLSSLRKFPCSLL